MIWTGAVIGPLVEPSNRSGVHAGPHRRCPCVPPTDCPRCDGTAEDAYVLSRATPEERRAFNVDMAASRARRAAWDAATAAALTTDQSTGGAA